VPFSVAAALYRPGGILKGRRAAMGLDVTMHDVSKDPMRIQEMTKAIWLD
jgi:hypothetical protein